MQAKAPRPGGTRRLSQTGIAVALAAALLPAGCRTPDRTPAWVDNPKTAYPEHRYLAAVGEGDTRRAAENAAAANLARIFEAHIESDERLLDQTRETGQRLERTTDFTADISILSAQTLFNVRHAEAWRDALGRHYAVAYIDRPETARLYRSKIDDLDGRARFLAHRAGEAGDPLGKYANLRAANRLAEEAHALLAQLKVIHPPSATAAAPGDSAGHLRQALAEAARQIRVRINFEGDSDRRMAACLEALFTGYGFVVGEPAVLDVAGRVAVADTGQRTAGLFFVRYELVVQARDPAGNVLATFGDKGRDGHVSLAEARNRSFRTMETAVKNGGTRWLDNYFDTLAEHR